MAINKKGRDPLPERFATDKEFEQFWDTHNLADYEDAWREVQFNVTPPVTTLAVPLEPSLARALKAR